MQNVGHPDKAVIQKWEAEVSQGLEYTPLLVDPNWVSGLAEIQQQEDLKKSMRLRLRDPSSQDQEGEEGEESDATHDTQVSIAQHSEVLVSEEKYVRELTTYKPKAEPAAEKMAVEGVPAEDPKTTEEKKEDVKDSEVPAQEKEDKKNEDVADPEDKTAKAWAPETEVPAPVVPEPAVPKPAESTPVEVSTEPEVKDSGVTPTEIPIPTPPVPSQVEAIAEESATIVSGVNEAPVGEAIPGEVTTTGRPVPEPNQEVCQGCHGTGLADADMNRAIRILRTAQLLQVKEEVKDPEDRGERLDPSVSQDVSYVKGSHTHVVVELCCSGNSEMKQACKKIGVFYIGVHARMQCTDVLQAVVKLLRVASSSMTCKGTKKDCVVHDHVSLPCTGGSPLLNFCTNQVREQHTADFKELL